MPPNRAIETDMPHAAHGERLALHD